MSVESIDFPNSLKLNRISYAANILTHLLGRKDAPMGDIGKSVNQLMLHFRSVRPEFVANFYDILTPVISGLFDYSAVAESCSRSGAYHVRRLTLIEQIKTLVNTIESDAELMTHLSNLQK